MAGAVRQPIDLVAFERYISNNVPAIKVPIEVKQVRQLKHDESSSIFSALEA
jgi:hypothetical protein